MMMKCEIDTSWNNLFDLINANVPKLNSHPVHHESENHTTARTEINIEKNLDSQICLLTVTWQLKQ